MVNVFPPTGKEGETSRKHGASVLGLIASHVYSRSAIIQMRVQIQLHRDACTNTVAHIVAHAKLNTVSHVLFFSLTVVLYSHAPALLYSCSHVYSSSAITFSSQPLASGPQEGVSSCIISFDRI